MKYRTKDRRFNTELANSCNSMVNLHHLMTLYRPRVDFSKTRHAEDKSENDQSFVSEENHQQYPSSLTRAEQEAAPALLKLVSSAAI